MCRRMRLQGMFVRLTERQYKELKEISGKSNVSMAGLVRLAVDGYTKKVSP